MKETREHNNECGWNNILNLEDVDINRCDRMPITNVYLTVCVQGLQNAVLSSWSWGRRTYLLTGVS